MAEIAYLLGAGASYGTRDNNNRILTGLPIVREVQQAFDEFVQWLRECTEKITSDKFLKILDRNKSEKDVLLMFIKDVINLEDVLYGSPFSNNKYRSPDDLAFALYNKIPITPLGLDKDLAISKYSILSFILCSLLMYEQSAHMYDERYNGFLKRISDPLKKNICDKYFVISWNYDQQMDIAFNNLYHVTLPVCVPQERYINNFSTANIIKINGSANFYNVNLLPVDYFKKGHDVELLHKILEQYALSHKQYSGGHQMFSGGTNDLTFAWDNQWLIKRKGFLQKKLSEVSSLVVIGYSFPDDNNNVDTEIIKYMPRLKKIYIQNNYPDPPFKRLKEIMNDNDKIKIILEKDISKFIIP